MTTQTEHGERPAVRYRAVSLLASTSLGVALLSVVAPFHWSLWTIPAAGITLGLLALRQIRKAPEEWTGRGVAWAGIGLSLGLLVFSVCWTVLRSWQEVPYGYQVVTYEMLHAGRGQRIPPEVFDLQDQKVFVRGYMMPTRRQTRLKQFVLCPAIPGCPFCTPDPKPTEMIFVRLVGDLEAHQTTDMRRLGGKFLIDSTGRSGFPYQLEADYLK